MNTSLLLAPRAGSLLALITLLLLAAVPAAAQIAPPRPGVSLPESYLEERAEDPTAFQFQRAWFGVAERARKAREAVRSARRSGEGLLSFDMNSVTQVQGSFEIPVIAGKFSNTGVDPFTPEDLQKKLFDGPNYTGTVTEFYSEISYGQLTLSGTVYGNGSGGLVQLPYTDNYYESGCNGICGGSGVGNFLRQLLDETDGDINFSQYDNDGPDGIPNSGDDDGFVDFVGFVHPEAGGECGTSNLWSHRWTYDGWWGSPYITNDPSANGGLIRVSDYAVMPLKSCTNLAVSDIGVYAHEFGHAFGLPDLYDIDGSSNGVGNWCLMGTGSWGGDGGHPMSPSHMSAWCKEQLGWVDPTVVCADQVDASLSAVETSGEVFKVFPHGDVDSEYFLIENRNQTGFDQYLPGEGLAIWHVDLDQDDNSNDARRLLDLEEADGQSHLDFQINRGDAGDLWPGSYQAAGFNDYSIPNARDYSGQFTEVEVDGFQGNDPMTFDIKVTECLVQFVSVEVLDAECGNNNGALDESETVDLRVGIVNDTGAPFQNVQVILTSLDSRVTVHRNSVQYGELPAGQTVYGNGTFQIETASGIYAGSQLPLQIEIILDDNSSTVTSFNLSVGRYVLLVDDDGSIDHAGYFINALNSLGRMFVFHNTGFGAGAPSVELLSGASSVIWFTGTQTRTTFEPEEQVVVQQFLDGGGSLFVTGQDIGLDLVQGGSAEDRAFYETYLHAEFVSDVTPYQTVTGVPGHPVGDGLSVGIRGGDGADNSRFSSRIRSMPGATDAFEYHPGHVAAVSYSGDHKTVYFAFNFESISTAADRQAVLGKVLDFLAPSGGGGPQAQVLAPTGEEPVDPCQPVTVLWSATDPDGIAEVDLLYETMSEPGVFHAIVLSTANTGSYDWDASELGGNSYRIKVRARNPGGLQGVATSPEFALASGPCGGVELTLFSPWNGGVYGTGNTISVAWAATPPESVASTTILYSDDDGQSWDPVPVPEGFTSPIDWTLPDAVTSSCRVRVEAVTMGGRMVTDENVTSFSIVDDDPPLPVLLRPRGGETVHGASVANIQVNSFDNIAVDSASISYTVDDGATWITAASGNLSFPYPWPTPAIASETCRIRVQLWDAAGNTNSTQSAGVFSLVLGVTGTDLGRLTRPTLMASRPNPMRSSTLISFYLPEEAPVGLDVFDVAGRRVRNLHRGSAAAGLHEFSWSGLDDSGRDVGTGVFLYVLSLPGERRVQKLVKVQ